MSLLWSDGKFRLFRQLNIMFASLAMFKIASLDVALQLRRNLAPFVSYNDPASWINVIKLRVWYPKQSSSLTLMDNIQNLNNFRKNARLSTTLQLCRIELTLPSFTVATLSGELDALLQTSLKSFT